MALRHTHIAPGDVAREKTVAADVAVKLQERQLKRWEEFPNAQCVSISLYGFFEQKWLASWTARLLVVGNQRTWRQVSQVLGGDTRGYEAPFREGIIELGKPVAARHVP